MELGASFRVVPTDNNTRTLLVMRPCARYSGHLTGPINNVVVNPCDVPQNILVPQVLPSFTHWIQKPLFQSRDKVLQVT